MKKLFLLALLVPALLISCSDTPTDGPIEGQGSIRLAGAPDGTWWITLQGPSTMTVQWPSDGVISDLNVGMYTVIVHSHQQMPAPAFETPYYVAQQDDVLVSPGQTTNIDELTAYQANSAILFGYAASLDGIDIIPSITQGEHTLVYSGANKEAAGFFAPGEVIIRLKNGTEDIKIDGANSKTFTIEAGQRWKINLTGDVLENGQLNINLVVVVLDTPTHEFTYQVGGDVVVDPVDALVGYWDVLETNIYYGGAGWSAAYNDHELWITKVNDTTVRIHNVTGIAESYGLEYGDMGDDIIATVDMNAMTISFAYQEVTPAWPLTGITNTYFCGLWENQFVDNIGRGIENVPIQIVDGKYHIAPATESVVTIDNEPYFCSWAALLFQGSDFAGVSDYFCGTFWTKQEGSRSSVTVSPQRDRVVKEVKNVSFSFQAK